MKISNIKKKSLLLFVLVVLIGFLFKDNVIHAYRSVLKLGDPANSSEIGHYQVEIEARKIDGIKRNISSLTYSKVSNTFFSTINFPPSIVELSKDGRLIRTIPLNFMKDAETIEHIEGNIFILADEKDYTIYAIELGEDSEITVLKKLRISLDESPTNSGFEGLAYSPTDQILYLFKEKDPIVIYKVKGFFGSDNLHIIDDKALQSNLTTQDISAADFYAPNNTLLIASHESKLVKEISLSGKVIDRMYLRKGWHGLKEDIRQAEGLAMDDNGDLYIVGEPNLLYKFVKKSR
ncbi:hypothetical protein SOASR030_09040 [Leminorella grimontii]|uniref:Uncharacterized protein n=1 Tax=Leminorella grimontii TaxID=82981 RepID=A0AAV5N287_9GAMM|nr:SdiA-regulated domain-containing protein [Leminorella grimontii]KFC96026.1 outer membrane protein [Leminorella grimontii ATCC 33999 = DSM 5078]GKX54792.1 hypothetical protein SOASR030_09040 [Leminorella grimontii]GKX58210.1 hypothetical protein SOASR031_05250 [Leminorella grimontii]VFS58441.1 Uncharacterized protein conserved in bacteria [Leminorella grimontii]